jgi:hypothetical protein
MCEEGILCLCVVLSNMCENDSYKRWHGCILDIMRYVCCWITRVYSEAEMCMEFLCMCKYIYIYIYIYMEDQIYAYVQSVMCLLYIRTWICVMIKWCICIFPINIKIHMLLNMWIFVNILSSQNTYMSILEVMLKNKWVDCWHIQLV